MPSAPRRLRWKRWLALVLLILLGLWGWHEYKRLEAERPELFPWTPLSLDDPVGAFTGDKIAMLGEDPQRCRALLGEAALGDRPAPPRRASEPACGYDDGIQLGNARPAYGDLIVACPVAAALAVWERDYLQPAARRHFGSEVARIETFGSYNCRRMYGRDGGPWSTHATADAIDISGFILADGRRITLVRDWDGDHAEAAFLRDVRDGACDLFRTTLSPDYNAAHRDHLHLDIASGRPLGGSLCR